MTDYGVDVSHYQTLTNPASVRGNGISFAWVKATEGTTYTDPVYNSHTSRLASAGIRVGAYHFARPGSASAQASFFRSRADIQSGNLFPVLDLEDDSIGNMDTFLCQFYDALKAPGMVVYGNLNYWENKLHSSMWGNRNIVGWIARYNGDPGNPGFTYPRMVAHQHTDKGLVPGFAGSVDRNCTMPGKSLADFTIGTAAPAIKKGFLMALSDAQQNTLYNQVMRLVPGDGTPPAGNLAHPAGDAYVADLDFRNRVEAKLAAVLSAVSALSKNDGITADQLSKVINDAVAQHVQITGNVTITGKAS